MRIHCNTDRTEYITELKGAQICAERPGYIEGYVELQICAGKNPQRSAFILLAPDEYAQLKQAITRLETAPREDRRGGA